MTSTASPRLVVVERGGRRVIPIDRPLVTFGRRSESDVQVSGPDVSRLHAELVQADGVVRLRDCGSKFGTFVNGERIVDQVLRPGDAIRLGRADQVQITFVVGEEPTSAERS